MKKVNILSRFKNTCFIGLNRVEFFPEGATESLFADTWQDVTDEQSRRNLALLFFAPRDLDGEPVDPYVYLTETDEDDEQSVMLAQQAFGNIPLIDMCRLRTNSPNMVRILVVADVIFHWDVNDCYIQPTTSLSWIKDIKHILKGYPRTTEKHIYTRWDNTKLHELDAVIHDVDDLEINQDAWINMPSFQEKFGNLALTASIALAAVAYAGIYSQQSYMQELSEQIRQADLETPAELNYDELNRAMGKQRRYMQYKDYISTSVRDVGNAIQLSGMKIHSVEVKSVDPQQPTENLFVNIQAEKDAYNGWLEEEPIAKALLGQSVTMSAIRRPPGGNRFKLEGLIELENVAQKMEAYKQRAVRAQQTSIAPQPIQEDAE